MSSPGDNNPLDAGLNQPAQGYELLEVIAESGLTQIYRARDSSLDTEVAIKVHRLTVDRERLFREARITGQLQHPGIIPVRDVGTLADGRPFMALKLIRGATLKHILRERATSADRLPQLLHAFEQVCQALAYAHSHGVIHRNIKPSKVMIGAFGEVQVLGWGMARVPTDGEVATSPGPGSLVGTPLYMPPEQARGETADTRSDVFGLGAILCEMLTGGPPFAGAETMDHPIRQSASGDLVDTFARLDACGADPELIALAKRCLSPNPADRPPDAAAVASLVTAYLKRVEDRQRHSPRGGRRGVQILGLVLLLLAVILLLVNAILLLQRA